MSYSRQAGTEGLVGHGRSIAPHVWFCGQADRLIQYQDVGFSYLYRLAYCWRLVQTVFGALADHEETRSHPLARGYDVCQFDCCARAAARAAMPDWDCHAVPGERSARATSFYRLQATA